MGIALVEGAHKFIHFNELIDKVWREGWKFKFLSYGRRLQLLRYSLKNYLSYCLCVISLPKCTLKKLSSIQANFFSIVGSLGSCFWLLGIRLSSLNLREGLVFSPLTPLMWFAKLNFYEEFLKLILIMALGDCRNTTTLWGHISPENLCLLERTQNGGFKVQGSRLILFMKLRMVYFIVSRPLM